MVKTVLKIVLPLVVIAASVAAGRAIVRMAPESEPRPTERTLPPIRVAMAEPTSVRMDVEVHGRVRPRTEISLIPQVSGRVDLVSPALRVGGFFDEGDLLVRIEQRDYELARTRGEAAVVQAQAHLDREKAETEVARREWKTYGEGEPNDLVLRRPQLAEATAMLASARARLDAAKLAFDRTEIRAPFDGRVRTESVDKGQFLAVGVPMATVFATDFAEVRLAVPVARLADLDLPLKGCVAVPDEPPVGAPGPAVVLSARFGGRELEWHGVVVRTEAEVDSRSRVVHARVRVEDPYGREDETRSPLLVGMFVRAVLPGRTVDGVFVLPADALRDGERIAIVDAEDRLRFREVEVLRRTETTVVVSGGLEGGERVCLTRLSAAVAGMRVRVESEDES